MGYIIAFIAGTMAGVTLMCIVSVTPKGQQEDEEQMEYLKEWNNKHENNKKNQRKSKTGNSSGRH